MIEFHQQDTDTPATVVWHHGYICHPSGYYVSLGRGVQNRTVFWQVSTGSAGVALPDHKPLHLPESIRFTNPQEAIRAVMDYIDRVVEEEEAASRASQARTAAWQRVRAGG